MQDQKKIVIFMGPPGSGKGSLAALCADKLGWVQLSTGALCRKHIAEQTKIGKAIDFAIKSGNLVSDDLITSMVEDWLDSSMGTVNTVILDGFPRSVAQAQVFDTILKDKFPQVALYIFDFVIPDEEVVKRLNSRLICQNKDCQAIYSSKLNSAQQPKLDLTCDRCGSPLGRRSDDQEEAIRVRLKVYHKHANDLLEYFRSVGRSIIEIDATLSLSTVFENFKALIGKQR